MTGIFDTIDRNLVVSEIDVAGIALALALAGANRRFGIIFPAAGARTIPLGVKRCAGAQFNRRAGGIGITRAVRHGGPAGESVFVFIARRACGHGKGSRSSACDSLRYSIRQTRDRIAVLIRIRQRNFFRCGLSAGNPDCFVLASQAVPVVAIAEEWHIELFGLSIG